MNYLGINLTNIVKDWYENYMILFRKFKEDLNKWRDISCSWFGRHNITEISSLPKLIDRFNAISVKILVRLYRNAKELDRLRQLWILKQSCLCYMVLRHTIKLEKSRQCGVGIRINIQKIIIIKE